MNGADRNSLIFSAMIALRETIQNDAEFKVWSERMEMRALLAECKCPVDKIEELNPMTACLQQRYFWKVYELEGAKGFIAEHTRRHEEAAECFKRAAQAHESMRALDERAQEEDDARCARAESAEADRLEQYYR